MSTFLVRTGTFQVSHGRKPRGHGSWGFRDTATGMEFWATGTFTEARAALKAAHGGGTWQVLP